MKTGRNDPCPCGSGKKYKKCCLAKDQAAEATASSASESAASAEETAFIESHEAAVEMGEPSVVWDLEHWPARRDYPRPDEDLPDLPPEQEGLVKGWWKVTAPLFRKRDADQLIRRVETALAELPDLFPHLGLHHEFLFELGAELGRRGRMPDYVALLKRLRREQPLTYSFSCGAYDSDIIAELLVAGQLAEIPDYFSFFRQYPDHHPDYCHETCDVLAWRGQAELLYGLCEAVAGPMAISAQVIGGDFALRWLIRRELSALYEAGDTSPDALARTAEAILQLGDRLELPLQTDTGRLRAEVEACLEPPRFALGADQSLGRLSLTYAAFLHRTGAMPWVQSLLLRDLLLDYFDWCYREKVPRCRLQKKEMEAFTVSRARQFLSLKGVVILAVLQTLVWFAEYLHAAGTFPPEELERVKRDCRQLFDAGRKVVESTDAAYRLCPAFERLIQRPVG